MSPSLQTMGFFMSEINFCNTKEQLNHLGEVVTGKVDGSPTGADIDTSTLPYTGQVRKTLPALEEEYQADIDNFVQVSDQLIVDKTAEFDASIANKEAEADAVIDTYRLLSKGDYAPGILLSNKFEYITYNGESYFATNPPYTTTATTPDADGNLFVGAYANEPFVNEGDVFIAETITSSKVFPEDRSYLPTGSQSTLVPSGRNSIYVNTGTTVNQLFLWEPSGDFSHEGQTITGISKNNTAGYDVTTNNGTFEFVTKDIYDARQPKNLPYGEVWAEGWGYDPDYWLGDGTINPSPKDNQPPLQAAIDFALYQSDVTIKRVNFGAGGASMGSTVHLGYGDTFKSIELSGSGKSPFPEWKFGGSVLFANFSNAPCVNFQGTRDSYLTDCLLVGLAYDELKSRNVGGTGSTQGLRYQESHYMVSNLAANAYSDTAPYCGVCVDAYSGSAPLTKYPDVNYPSFLPQTQYNKAFSNKPRLKNVNIAGFAYSTVTQPSGSDGNGDFLEIDSCTFFYALHHVSISHTQSRLVTISNSFLENCYIPLVNNRTGKKQGNFGGLISNTSFDRIGYMMDIQGGTSGGLSFIGCYGELIGSLGSYSKDNSINSFPINFTGVTFNFAEVSTLENGVPPLHFDVGLNAPVTFENSTLYVDKFFITTGQVELEQSTIRSSDTADGIGEAICLNANGSLISELPQRQPAYNQYRARKYSLSTQNAIGQNKIRTKQRSQDCGRDSFISNHSTGFFWSKTSLAQEYSFWQSYVADGATVSADGRFNYLDINYSNARKLIGIGDLLQVQDGGTIQYYFIESGTQPTFKARRLSGFYKVGSTYNDLGLDSQITTGTVSSLISRLYTPADISLGTITNGSNIITDCGRADGYFVDIANEYQVGDMFFVADQSDRPFSRSPKITGIDVSARTITVDIPATDDRSGWVLPPAIRVD